MSFYDTTQLYTQPEGGLGYFSTQYTWDIWA